MLYSKYIDNSIVIKSANEIIVRTNGKQIINPSHEQIINDGWIIYEIPLDIIEVERKKMIEKIQYHDSSELVNIFFINGYPIWLDKATRVGLKLRFEAELQNNQTNTILWYNGVSFQLNIEQALIMLHEIELYASKCYDNTQKHIAQVKKLTNVDEIINYDFSSGYPEHLSF